LTSKARSSALSPSGKRLAYSFEEDGKLFLILKPNDDTVNSAATEKVLVETGATRLAGLAFSPDEQWIYYTLYEADKIYADLYRVPIGGGEPQKLVSKIENAPGFSPDGGQIVFLRLGETKARVSDNCRRRRTERTSFAYAPNARIHHAPRCACLVTGRLDHSMRRRTLRYG
jgi:Tol biopolymer transport system component